MSSDTARVLPAIQMIGYPTLMTFLMATMMRQGCITCGLAPLTNFLKNLSSKPDICDKNAVDQGFWSKTSISYNKKRLSSVLSSQASFLIAFETKKILKS